MSSFQSQYGLRLSRELPAGMKWNEFADLLCGIGPDTALGRIVAIRAETDEKILKQFTPEQNRIRDEWRKKRAKQVSIKERDAFLEETKETFLSMAGLPYRREINEKGGEQTWRQALDR